MIKIGNKHYGDDGYYVGRGSVLGNPYPIDETHDRNCVCDLYEKWFKQNKDTGLVKKQLDLLLKTYEEKGEITLLCYCAPKRCHAETIKKWILSQK